MVGLDVMHPTVDKQVINPRLAIENSQLQISAIESFRCEAQGQQGDVGEVFGKGVGTYLI